MGSSPIFISCKRRTYRTPQPTNSSISATAAAINQTCFADRCVGRDDLPCFQIGVIHAFLRVFQIPQNPVCQSPEPSAVGRIGFGNGRFISGPEETNDFLVIQERSHPFNLLLTLVVREILRRVTNFLKKVCSTKAKNAVPRLPLQGSLGADNPYLRRSN